MARHGFPYGELVVQNDAAPSGDCPPDVYEFGFARVPRHLCIRCAASRLVSDRLSMDGMGALIKGGICEDCGNDG